METKQNLSDIKPLDIMEEVNYNCSSEYIPDFYTYFSAVEVSMIIIICVSAIAVLIICYMYYDTLKYVMKHTSAATKTSTVVIISVYPCVALVCFSAIVVPRAYLLAETVAQVMFACGMYHLFGLYLTYCGGETELIRKTADCYSINPQTVPCCCWPCCRILPKLEVTKKNLNILRMLVLQLPLLQGALYVVLLVVWAEKQTEYPVDFAYVQPVIVVSILIAVWGLTMLVFLIQEILHPDHCLKGKFFALKLVPLSLTSFAFLSRILIGYGILPCHPPITPSVFACLLYNGLALVELIVLAYWARHLYKKSLPGNDDYPETVEQGDSTLQNSINLQSEIISLPPEAAEHRDSWLKPENGYSVNTIYK